MILQSPVAILATLSLSLCSAHIGGGSMMMELDSRIYCGRNLARALAEICSFENFDKRSDGTMYGGILAPHYKEHEIGWPWLSPHKAQGLAAPRGKRLVAGVVDECCSKPCSLDEMLNYCN